MWNKRTQKTKLICHGDFESGDMTNVKNQAEMREVATARKKKINGMGNLKRKKSSKGHSPDSVNNNNSTGKVAECSVKVEA